MNDVKADRTYQMLKVEKINEAGFTEAMKALRIYNSDEEYSMLEIANMEASNPDGDHSFLNHMPIWFVMEAPLYFIQALSVLGKRNYLMSTMTRIDNTYSDELANITDKTPGILGRYQMYRLMMSATYMDIKRVYDGKMNTINWKRLFSQLHNQLNYPDFIQVKEVLDVG